MKKTLLLALFAIVTSFTMSSCLPELNEPVNTKNIKGTVWEAKHFSLDNIWFKITFTTNKHAEIDYGLMGKPKTKTIKCEYLWDKGVVCFYSKNTPDKYVPEGVEENTMLVFFNVGTYDYCIADMQINKITTTSIGKLHILSADPYFDDVNQYVEIKRIK